MDKLENAISHTFRYCIYLSPVNCSLTHVQYFSPRVPFGAVLLSCRPSNELMCPLTGCLGDTTESLYRAKW